MSNGQEDNPPFQQGREDVLYVSRVTMALLTAWGNAQEPRLADPTVRSLAVEAGENCGDRALQMLGATLVSLSVYASRAGAMGGGTPEDVLRRVYEAHEDDSDIGLLNAIFAVVGELTRYPRSEPRLWEAIEDARDGYGYLAMLGLTQVAWMMAEQVALADPDLDDGFGVLQAMALEGEVGMEADGEGHTDKPYRPWEADGDPEGAA